MFNQASLGKKLKGYRKEKNLTQDEVAEKIGVSGQAVSKWEKGECLPDVYNLKLLGQLYRISVDSLLDIEGDGAERVAETFKIGGAVFEVIEKSATILAGKIIYAKDYSSTKRFHSALEAVDEEQKKTAYEAVTDCVLPKRDITLSVNFWLSPKSRAMGFVRETTEENQAEGIDIYRMPASLYLRAYTDRETAQLMAKEQCDIWELFAYIRNYVMPERKFIMADSGAQELEVFDTSEHKTGYAYMPVMRSK